MIKISKLINFVFFIFLFLLIFFNNKNINSQELGDLGGAVQDSMSDTISKVKQIDLGEAKSDLAKGIDQAMDNMAEGMDFALKALEEGNADTALQTMEMLEATMDIAISEIPNEEFMDFSKVNFDDFSQEELAAAQSMMGDMMKKNMGAMTQMMGHMNHVEGAGFDVGGFMGDMNQHGFGFEKMFGENMDSMGAMFGEDMGMIDMIDGMAMPDEMLAVFVADHEGMGFEEMMNHMEEMGDMTQMMSEHMDFENFASMTEMMDEDHMKMMTDGMQQMMEEGHFDHFEGNMEMMGNMIKGEAANGMEDHDHEDFFKTSNEDSMQNMMTEHMDHMGESFDGMTEDQMTAFAEHMSGDKNGGAIMGMGEMSNMGMDIGHFEEHGDMFGGEHGGEHGGDMFGGEHGGDMFGGEHGGDMFGGEHGDDMFGEAFGGEDQEGGGMFSEKGFEGGGEHQEGGGEHQTGGEHQEH